MARCSPMDGGCCCKVWRTSSSVSPHNSLGREGGACGYFLAIPPPSHSRLSGHIRLFCTYSSPHFGIHSVVSVEHVSIDRTFLYILELLALYSLLKILIALLPILDYYYIIDTNVCALTLKDKREHCFCSQFSINI